MKKLYTMVLAAALIGTFTSCDDFLDYTPTAVVDEDKAFSEPDKMVNSAYAMLGNCWYSYPFNLWPYGDLSSDDCLKGGGGTGDTGYHDVEIWSTLTSTKGELDELWYRLYCAVSRCNRALVSLQQNGESTLGAEVTKQREAEVRFLRAHFYFKLLSMYRQIPWIDEKVYEDKTTESTSNTQFTYEQLWQKVIADFQTAYDVLPAKQKDGDIFLPDNKNSKESVFAVQASDYSEDHTTFGRGNWSNVLNGCWGMWSCGWDFHKPSQDLVNAFKTKNGLPEFDDYNKTCDYPVNGKPNSQKWDPRLFHTVGMPTFPYKYESEYKMTTANSRTPNVYGYYTSLKEVPQRSKGETFNGSWQAFAMNDYVLRYSDIMLMRAEALIELGRLAEARTIINDIRQRAKNSVDKHIDYAKAQCDIALYPESYFQDKETARKCLRWERRLEMAMENGRFFDLRRWGIASETLNKYFASEQNDKYGEQTYAQYLKDAKFTPGKNEFYPVPYNQLYYIPGLYKQNKGYE